MKRVVRWLAVTVWLIPAVVLSAHLPVRVRSEIKVPDLDGYVTLKCDFHMHTVFSDGLVWPTVRVEEAWREGLDAIALTEHIEHLARSNDVRSATNRNRSVEIARPAGAELDIIVIPGSEITRKMPPGHINVIFVTNANALVTEDWREAVRAARQQGAVIFWNHPGWTNQLGDGVVR
ncbi:MAG: histidinol-phosphatase, partial [Verrucomicrobiae bacterium]|nr:histidinol-phosphatase [Verrucomicrobiae bacterium]